MEKRRTGKEKALIREEERGDGEKERRNVEEKAIGRKKEGLDGSWEGVVEEKETPWKDDEREIRKIAKIRGKTPKVRRGQEERGDLHQRETWKRKGHSS